MPLSVTIGNQDILPGLQDCNFSAGINGGYATATLTFAGDIAFDLLTRVAMSFEGLVVWEGLVTDTARAWTSAGITTVVTCSGYQRTLDWQKVRAPYSVRQISWEDTGVGDGAAFISGAATFNYQPNARGQVAVGQYDASDSTKRGIKFTGDGTVLGASDGIGKHYTLPVALPTAGKLRGTIAVAGAVGSGVAQMSLWAAYSTDGATWTGTQHTAAGNIDQTLAAGTKYIRIGWRVGTTGLTPTSADTIEVKSIRILGTSVTEDDTATQNQEGFYPSTLINDLLARQTLIGSDLEAINDIVLPIFGSFNYQPIGSLLDTLFSYSSGYWGVYAGPTLRFRRQGRTVSLQAQDIKEYSLRTSAEVDTQQIIVEYTDAQTGSTQYATANIDSGTFATSPIGKQDVYQAGTVVAQAASTLASQIAALRQARPPIAVTCQVSGSVLCEVGPCLHLVPGDSVTLVGVRGLTFNTFDLIEMSYSMRDDALKLALGYYEPTPDLLLARLVNEQEAAL